MLKELFQFVLDNYITEEKKVSSASALYRVLVAELPNTIGSIFPFRTDLKFNSINFVKISAEKVA